MRSQWENTRLKTSWASTNLCFSMSDVKVLYRSPTSFSFVDFSTLLSFELVLLLFSRFLGRSPTTLASPAFWGLQGNLDFAFTDLHNGLSRPPCRDTHDKLLNSTPLLSHGGRSHNHFLVYLTLKTEPHSQHSQVLLLARARTWTPHSITFLSDFCFQLFIILLSYITSSCSLSPQSLFPISLLSRSMSSPFSFRKVQTSLEHQSNMA